MFFEAKTKRTTIDENNAYRRVKEMWLLEAESYTEAEATVTKFMKENFEGEDFLITKIQPSKISIVGGHTKCESFAFYKVKVEAANSSGGDEKFKRESVYILVRAESVEDSVNISEKIGEEKLVNSEVTKSDKTKFSGVIG